MNIPDSVIEAAKAACDKCNGRDTWDDTVLAMLTAALAELEKSHAVVPRTDTPAIQALIDMKGDLRWNLEHGRSTVFINKEMKVILNAIAELEKQGEMKP